MNSRAFYTITYGLYIVGSHKGDKLNAQIANTLVQVSSDPVTVSVCINRNNLTHEFIKESRSFSASILSQDAPISFIGKFGFNSGRDANKIDGVNYKIGETGSPIITDNALAYVDAKVISEGESATHTIFIGEVLDADILNNGEPMTYAYYHQVKNGTTPKSAPSYIKEQKEEVMELDKYECLVCGYVYDPAKGDPSNAVAAGTPFEELPDDWVCPICGAKKSRFEKKA